MGQGPDGRHEGAGEAEVGDLEAAFTAHEQVLRLEVPVAGSVRGCDDGRMSEMKKAWVGLESREYETKTHCAYRCIIPRAWQKARPLKIWKRKDYTWKMRLRRSVSWCGQGALRPLDGNKPAVTADRG